MIFALEWCTDEETFLFCKWSRLCDPLFSVSGNTFLDFDSGTQISHVYNRTALLLHLLLVFYVASLFNVLCMSPHIILNVDTFVPALNPISFLLLLMHRN